MVIEQNLRSIIIDLFVLNGLWWCVCVSVFRGSSLSFKIHFVAGSTWAFLQ